MAQLAGGYGVMWKADEQSQGKEGWLAPASFWNKDQLDES